MYLLKEVCEISDLLKILKFITELLKIVFFITPFILMIMLTIDFFKAVISSNADEMKKAQKLAIRRLIMGIVLFLVPTIVKTVFLGIEGSTSTVLNNYNTCLSNMSNISYYEEIEKTEKEKVEKERQAKIEEEQKKLKQQEAQKVKAANKAKKKAKTNSENGSTGIIKQGKKYNLTKAEIKRLAALCVREQGNQENGIRAEAELIANRYELYGKRYKNPSEYNLHDTFFKGQATVDRSLATKKAINVVTQVFNLGNRTLFPRYVMEHDCIYCGSYGWDVVKIKVDGKTITSSSGRLNRNNYKEGKTIIYNTYGSTWKFYSFPTNISDPFGYTKSAYKTVTGEKDW